MAKILFVEDDTSIQGSFRLFLEDIIGKGNLDITDNYNSAEKLVDKNVYDLYIVDGAFPLDEKDKNPRPVGLTLAKEIKEKEGNPNKIIMISVDDSTLFGAKKLGITKLYSKSVANEKLGYKYIDDLFTDVKQYLKL